MCAVYGDMKQSGVINLFLGLSLMTDDQATKYIADEKKQTKSDAEDDATMDGPPDGPPPGPPPGGGGPAM